MTELEAPLISSKMIYFTKDEHLSTIYCLTGPLLNLSLESFFKMVSFSFQISLLSKCSSFIVANVFQ
jgi:hypothetical protein